MGSINAIATLCASVPVAAEAAGATPETAVACTAVARKISESVAPPHRMDAMNGGVRHLHSDCRSKKMCVCVSVSAPVPKDSCVKDVEMR